MTNVDEFLKNLGKPDGDKSEQKWYEIIKPTTVNIILGKKGMGKSTLGYFLLETIERHYGLLPVVVNLPRDKQKLLPASFVIKSLDEIKHIENSIVLIDEGTTMLPAGQAKLEEIVKGFQALSRQRNQIIIFIFHSSSDVGSRILRGVDTILLKEPSQRQIQHGSKDSWWYALLLEARDKFKTIADMKEDKRKYTYIDCEEPEFRGLVANSTPSFWSEELSCAWAGTQVARESQLGYNMSMGHSPSPQRRRWVTAPGEIEPIPEAFGIGAEYGPNGTIVGFRIADPEGNVIRKRTSIVEEIHRQYPEVDIGKLENSAISYYDYYAELELK